MSFHRIHPVEFGLLACLRLPHGKEQLERILNWKSIYSSKSFYIFTLSDLVYICFRLTCCRDGLFCWPWNKSIGLLHGLFDYWRLNAVAWMKQLMPNYLHYHWMMSASPPLNFGLVFLFSVYHFYKNLSSYKVYRVWPGDTPSNPCRLI